MPLINPPLTKEDFINSRWQDVINSSERKECSAYNRVFWNKAREAKEAGNVREQYVFEILAFITDAAIKPESTEEFFAKVFQNLTDEHLNFLTEIAPEVSNPELQARIADILWVKKGNYQMSRLAVTAYLQSAAELEDPEKWSRCFERIERALRLARKINYQPELVVAHIEAVLNRYNGEDPLWLSVKLMKLLQEYKLGNPTKYAALAEKAAIIAESSQDWDKARNYWEIKAEWHRIDKNAEQTHAARMLAAETYVKEAKDSLTKHPQPYSKASDDLQKALEAFEILKSQGTEEGKAAAKARYEEVRKLLPEYQKQSLNELITVSSQFNISAEVELARTYVKGKKFQDAIFALVLLGIPPKVSYLQQSVEKTPLLFQFMPITIMNEMSKVVARQSSNSDEAEKAIRFEMYRNAVLYHKLYAQAYIEPARDQINLEHSVEVKDLFPFVSNNLFVPPGREYQFAKGLYAGLIGDFFTSTHILIPQIENSIRYLLRRQGALPSKIDINKGIEDERDLNTTLFPRNYPQINSIFDEDTLFDLQGLLIERFGSNLRNRMAHGLINDSEFNSPIMSYFWWVTLRLCCLPMLKHEQQVEESNPWVKFDGIFKDDPLFDDFVEDMDANRRELDAEVAASEASLEENQSA
ncbi:MAG: DUF4209 domain-containing protein [Nostoc sp.]|uniref:DUF4209 domain-containing protein n=1 Tax=Nostoc sp. TaxID=1180 RepID=UPI002FFCB652